MQNEELRQLIEICAEETGLPTATVEKDFYVTHTIHTLSKIKDDYFYLVFQGGTALAKAHRLVDRMSEDCDFRIHTTSLWKQTNPSQKRKLLRDFRHTMVSTLQQLGFAIPEDMIKVRDEGHYFHFNLLYPSLYETNEVLRPHILLEFMVVTSKLPTIKMPVTTLIRQVLGETIKHEENWLDCVSVSETAAEKWVALTRRVANAMRKPEMFLDSTLVRHIYDLYCIGKKQPIGEDVYSLIDTLIKEDASRYKNQNFNYVQDPIREIKWSLALLSDSKEWENNWYNFMRDMVYGENKPDYPTALSHLNIISDHIFTQLSCAEPQQQTQVWYESALPNEIEALRTHASPMLNRISNYLLKLNNAQGDVTHNNNQTQELLVLLTKSALNDPIQAPLMMGCAPVFSKKAQSIFANTKDKGIELRL